MHLIRGVAVHPGLLVVVAGLAVSLSLGGCASGPGDSASAGATGVPGQQGSASGGETFADEALDLRTRQLREDQLQLVTRARDRVFPALVNINVVTVEYWGGKETKGISGGSGTIISADGYVVTNAHVTDNGKRFRLTLSDRTEVDAALVGEDVWTDIAVLKIDSGALQGRSLPHATWGDSSRLVVGDTVMAMGSPFFLSRTVTLGIVSNTERVFSNPIDGEQSEDDWGSGTSGIFTNWVQHDALINPGNSGGPLVNLKGEVVGVNARGGSGTGFAIPAEQARGVVEQLIANNGEVLRSQIGVNFRAINRTPFERGVIVNSVTENGPADKAGVKAGDLLVAIDGKPLTVRFPEEVPPLLRLIGERPIGSSMTLTLERDGREVSAVVGTEKLLREMGDQAALRLWGFSVAEITERIAQNRRLPDTRGAMVWGVRPGSPASTAEPPLRGGDIVRSINGTEVENEERVIEIYRTLMSQDPVPEFVLVGFDRGQTSQVTTLKPRPDKKVDPPREVPKAWIGIDTQPVLRELAGQLGHPDVQGFRVTRVYPGTVASGSDLRVGDLITSLNGEAIAPRTLQDAGLFQRRVRQLSIQGQATLGVLRAGEQTEVKVGLERTRIGPDEALRDNNRDFELSVRDITFFDRDDNRWSEDTQGVLVENAEMAGWAGLAGVRPGDLIQRIAGQAVADVPAFRRVMEQVAKDQPVRVPFVVLRGDRTAFLFAEPEWKPTTLQEAQEQAREDAGAAGGQDAAPR